LGRDVFCVVCCFGVATHMYSLAYSYAPRTRQIFDHAGHDDEGVGGSVPCRFGDGKPGPVCRSWRRTSRAGAKQIQPCSQARSVDHVHMCARVWGGTQHARAMHCGPCNDHAPLRRVPLPACLWAATHPSVPLPEHPTPRCHGHLGQCRGTCHMSLPKHRSMGDGYLPCACHGVRCPPYHRPQHRYSEHRMGC
jgi:hypothetical protein